MNQQEIINRCFQLCRGLQYSSQYLNELCQLIHQHPWLLWQAVEKDTGKSISHYADTGLLETMFTIYQNCCQSNYIPAQEQENCYNMIFCRRAEY